MEKDGVHERQIKICTFTGEQDKCQGTNRKANTINISLGDTEFTADMSYRQDNKTNTPY